MRFLDREFSDRADKLWSQIEPEITTTVGYDILEDPCVPQVELLPDNRALITICGNTSPSDFEYLLFHELLHVWQHDKGFPQLKTTIAADKKVTIMLNSLVLDGNVNCMLDKYKIHYSKRKINEKYEQLKLESKRPNNNEMYYLIQCVNVGLSAATVKGDCLANLFSQSYNNFKIKYENIISIMKNANLETSDGCKNVFSQFLKALKLAERIRLAL